MEAGKNKCSAISIAVLDDGWFSMAGKKIERKRKKKCRIRDSNGVPKIAPRVF